MTSVQRQGQPTQRGQASKALTDWSNNRDHENPLKFNKPGLLEASKAPTGPSKTPKTPTGPPKAPFLVLSVPNIAWYTQKDMDHLFRRFSKYQKVDLKTNSRPRPWTSTAVGLIWNVITSVNNAKTILPLVEPPDQTKFRLQPLFCKTASTFVGSNINRK